MIYNSKQPLFGTSALQGFFRSLYTCTKQWGYNHK